MMAQYALYLTRVENRTAALLVALPESLIGTVDIYLTVLFKLGFQQVDHNCSLVKTLMFLPVAK